MGFASFFFWITFSRTMKWHVVKAAANRSDFSSDLKIEGRMKSRMEIRLLNEFKFFVCDTFSKRLKLSSDFFFFDSAFTENFVFFHTNPNPSDILSDLRKMTTLMKSRIGLRPPLLYMCCYCPCIRGCQHQACLDLLTPALYKKKL